MRRIVCVVAVVAFGCGLFYAMPAWAAHGFFQVDGSAVQAPDSQIELTSVFAVADPIQGGANVYTTVECAFFVNKGPKDVRRVRVRWSYAATDAGVAGTTIGSDTKDISGGFAVGVPQEVWPNFGNAFGKQCQKVKADVSGDHLVMWDKKQAATLTAQVEAVDYADGTSWTIPAK